MVDDIFFSSKRGDWETPNDLFLEIDRVFNFTLDCAASRSNRKCRQYIDEGMNAFKQEWVGRCWLNPPYSRKVGDWVREARGQSSWEQNRFVVVLVPARTDTKWFHYYARHAIIIFLKGRLKFGGSKNAAPFPSMLLVFDSRLATGIRPGYLANLIFWAQDRGFVVLPRGCEE